MIRNSVSNFLNIPNVAGDDLYSPLKQEVNVCGVGANLILVHDPPLHTPSDKYTYINVIESIEPNSPASKAGMRARDIILQVDDTKLDHKEQLYLPDDVAALIRGPEGSEVKILIEREGRDEDIEFVLTRVPLDVSKMATDTPSPVKKKLWPVSPSATGSPLPSLVRKIWPVTP